MGSNLEAGRDSIPSTLALGEVGDLRAGGQGGEEVRNNLLYESSPRLS